MPEPCPPCPECVCPPRFSFNFEHVKDLIAIFAGALLLLSNGLDQNGFHGIPWASVVAAGIGGIIAWSRNGTGGFRKEEAPALAAPRLELKG